MIKISRKTLAEYFILALYSHGSLQKICDGDDMIIPPNKYADFLSDFGIIMGQLMRHVAKVEIDDEDM